MTRLRHGFSLVEMVISVAILGIIGAAATRMMTAQSRFYDLQTNIRTARSVARSSSNVVLADLRMVQDSGGVDSASSDGRTLRLIVPYRFGLVCGTSGTKTIVSMLPVDSAMNAMSTYAGFAWRSATTGRYTIVTPTNPTTTDAPTTSTSAQTCTGTGANQAQIKTVTLNSRSGDVYDLNAPAATGATATAPVFLWQKVTYQFKTSSAYPSYYGLWRTVLNGTSEELLAPFDTSARFRYYVAGEDTSRVTVPSLDQIRGVALVLNTLSPRTVSNTPTTHQTSKMLTSVFFKNVRAY